MNLWLQFLKNYETPNNPNFEITLFLTDPETIRNWNNHGLSNDKFSLENGIIITNSHRCPFIIDTENQAWKFIKNIESKNGIKIIDYRSSNNMHDLESALKNGYPILIQIDFGNIDPRLISILSKSIVKQSRFMLIK